MRAHGLPTTRTLARYGGTARRRRAAPAGRPGARAVPARAAERRLFGKPPAGAAGRAGSAIDGWEPATDSLSLSDGERVSVLRLQRLLEPFAADGYLLQHGCCRIRSWRPCCRPRVDRPRAGAGERVRPVPASRRLENTRRPQFADGFWSAGNLLAAIDPDTGRVWRVVDDIHPRQREIELHPDSRLPLHASHPARLDDAACHGAGRGELFPANPCSPSTSR